MKWKLPILLVLVCGCSTAPVADVLDFFAPGRLAPGKTPPYGGVCNPVGPPTAAAPGSGPIPPPVPIGSFPPGQPTSGPPPAGIPPLPAPSGGNVAPPGVPAPPSPPSGIFPPSPPPASRGLEGGGPR